MLSSVPVLHSKNTWKPIEPWHMIHFRQMFQSFPEKWWTVNQSNNFCAVPSVKQADTALMPPLSGFLSILLLPKVVCLKCKCLHGKFKLVKDFWLFFKEVVDFVSLPSSDHLSLGKGKKINASYIYIFKFIFYGKRLYFSCFSKKIILSAFNYLSKYFYSLLYSEHCFI